MLSNEEFDFERQGKVDSEWNSYTFNTFTLAFTMPESSFLFNGANNGLDVSALGITYPSSIWLLMSLWPDRCWCKPNLCWSNIRHVRKANICMLAAFTVGLMCSMFLTQKIHLQVSVHKSYELLAHHSSPEVLKIPAFWSFAVPCLVSWPQSSNSSIIFPADIGLWILVHILCHNLALLTVSTLEGINILQNTPLVLNILQENVHTICAMLNSTRAAIIPSHVPWLIIHSHMWSDTIVICNWRCQTMQALQGVKHCHSTSGVRSTWTLWARYSCRANGSLALAGAHWDTAKPPPCYDSGIVMQEV